MELSLVRCPLLLSTAVINVPSLSNTGILAVKGLDGTIVKCLRFINDPFAMKQTIKVPRDLIDYIDKCIVEVLDAEEVSIAEQVTLKQVYGIEEYEFTDEAKEEFTFKGDLLLFFSEGHMNIYKVTSASSEGIFRINHTTAIEYIQKELPATANYLQDLLSNTMGQVEERRISLIYGLPNVLERLAWETLEPKLDLQKIIEDEAEVPSIEDTTYYIFHAEFLQTQTCIDKIVKVAESFPEIKFIFFMGAASEAHPLAHSLSKIEEGTHIHFPPLSIDLIKSILEEHKLDSLSPTLLAGLSLDAILAIIGNKEVNSLEEMVRKAQEEHWRSFGVVLDPTEYSWDRVIGYEAQIEHLRTYLFAQYRHPEEFKALRLKPPKGILLHGPSGCGKTLLARTLASDRLCTIIEIRTVQLYSKYFGETEERIRQVFASARQRAPCVLVFDEFEGVGVKRSLADSGDTTGVSVRVLTTLLNELDGVQELEGVTVVACTNRKEVIDEALLRPGRLDVHIEIGHPTEADLRRFLDSYLSAYKHAFEIDGLLNVLKGKSFGQVRMCIDNAALSAQIRKSPVMEMADLQAAINS